MSIEHQQAHWALTELGHGPGFDAAFNVLRDYIRQQEADARALWAVRVLCRANINGHHVSFPYPHRLGGFELIDSPERAPDVLHHGDTAELCLINAATALVAADPSLDPDGVQPRESAYTKFVGRRVRGGQIVGDDVAPRRSHGCTEHDMQYGECRNCGHIER